MAKIQVNHYPSNQIITFDTEDLVSVTNEAGVTIIADGEAAVIRLKLTWPELFNVLGKAFDYLRQRIPAEGGAHV